MLYLKIRSMEVSSYSEFFSRFTMVEMAKSVINWFDISPVVSTRQSPACNPSPALCLGVGVLRSVGVDHASVFPNLLDVLP